MSGQPDERSQEERNRDRQMIELLNELRVAMPGVQILFGFLLAVPFAQRFTTISSFQRHVFLVVLVCTALSSALLIAPTALNTSSHACSRNAARSSTRPC